MARTGLSTAERALALVGMVNRLVRLGVERDWAVRIVAIDNGLSAADLERLVDEVSTEEQIGAMP